MQRNCAVALLSLLFVLAPAAASVAPDGCSLFEGINLVGESIPPDMPVLVDSPAECCAACQQRRGAEVEQSAR